VAPSGYSSTTSVVAVAFRGALGALRSSRRLQAKVRETLAGEAGHRIAPEGFRRPGGLRGCCFIVGAPIALVALGRCGAAVCSAACGPSGCTPRSTGNLLVMFAGLFVVVQLASEHNVVLARCDRNPIRVGAPFPRCAARRCRGRLSNVVSNVPAVLLLKSAVNSLAPRLTTPGSWLGAGHGEHALRQPDADRLRREPHRPGARETRGRRDHVRARTAGWVSPSRS